MFVVFMGCPRPQIYILDKKFFERVILQKLKNDESTKFICMWEKSTMLIFHGH